MSADAGRIALVAPLEDAGPELATMLFGLLERGWDPHLVLDDPTGSDRPVPPALGLVARARRLRLGTPASGRLRRRRGAVAHLRALEPRVVHFLRADHARSLVGAVSDAAKMVASFSAADASVAGLDTPDYYRPLWRRADALHFPDSAVLSGAVRRGLPPEKPRAVIPPFIDLGSFSPNGACSPEARPLRVLCAGRLEWAGGYEHGLHALALAAERGTACECRVLGDGAHLPALLFARHQLGLGETVSFEGVVTSEKLADQLAWADVFLAPTVIGGMPDHVVDAAAMELCIMVAAPGPLSEIELDNSVATTVPRRDPDALAGALVTVAADPARRARMGSAARAWALERFEVDENLDRRDELYRRTLTDGALS